jgi:DNA invertase Pin-like site-specific DNA recombinase
MALWVGYRRVSHVGARAGDRFHSPEEQADVIRAWVKRRGDRVDLPAPELDESGGNANRPILAAAVERVERGEVCGIVVAYLSRASRSVRHLLELWDRIEAAGGQVVAVSESIDTSTPAGRLNRTMLAAIAEHELDLHQERFENLRRTATERGIWQRRQTPRGYCRDEATRRLIADERADEVRAAFQARASGESPVRIAERLGMTPSGVRQLLANRVYLGELRVGEHVNPTAHEPLVDLDTWRAVQQRTVARPPRSTRGPG